VFATIDGQGLTISAFNGALTGMLLPYYTAGSLYGRTADEAFRVDTGPGVNTDETIADGELRAVIYLRMSAAAELVHIEIVKVALSESLV
jgi:hypothetical protein